MSFSRRRRPSFRTRHAITLLEVLVTTTILLGSVMVLSRLAFLARRHAIGSEDRTGSQMLCQNLIDEVLAGIRPLDSVSATETDDGEWIYSIDVERLSSAPLVAVRVTVARLEEDEESLPTDDELLGYRLVRWLRPGKRQVSAASDLLGPPEEYPSSFGTEGDGLPGESMGADMGPGMGPAP